MREPIFGIIDFVGQTFWEDRALIFLKLGGSLITEKNQPHTPRLETLNRLATEIAAARSFRPEMQLIVGHGSGSFGHVPARQYGTRAGVRSQEDWAGFAEVWQEARALNQLVIEACRRADLPVLGFPPSAGITACDGQVQDWNLYPLQSALQAGLVPVIYGDVAFDVQRGGTILSTEDLFLHLARKLQPESILLAGLEPGVWADYPQNTHLVREITPANFGELRPGIQGSAATDVTGGMLAKVQAMLNLIQVVPGLQIQIFSGMQAGLVQQALLGSNPGTALQRG